MKKTLACLTLCALPLLAHAQAGGIYFNLEDQSPLSKWGRWTNFDKTTGGFGLRLGGDKLSRAPVTAQWQEGNFVFKLSKDALSERHDLFFGLKVSQNTLQTTSLGCMSNSNRNGYGDALCGVQLDLNLR